MFYKGVNVLLEILCTDQAIEKINSILKPNTKHVKLAYDPEGCGCIMSALAQLWVVDRLRENDRFQTGNSYPILYDIRHEIFFEEQLIIDYHHENRSFILKSNQQNYNSSMQLIEKEGTHEQN